MRKHSKNTVLEDLGYFSGLEGGQKDRKDDEGMRISPQITENLALF